MGSRIFHVPLWLLSGAVFLTACGSPPAPAPAARESQDAAFCGGRARGNRGSLPPPALGRDCTSASTSYDDRLEDYSRDAVTSEVAELRKFRERASTIAPSSLSQANQLDREHAAARHRFAPPDARHRPPVGNERRHLQQRPDQQRRT